MLSHEIGKPPGFGTPARDYILITSREIRVLKNLFKKLPNEFMFQVTLEGFDKVMFAIGRHPNTATLGLDKAGIK